MKVSVVSLLLRLLEILELDHPQVQLFSWLKVTLVLSTLISFDSFSIPKHYHSMNYSKDD